MAAVIKGTSLHACVLWTCFNSLDSDGWIESSIYVDGLPEGKVKRTTAAFLLLVDAVQCTPLQDREWGRAIETALQVFQSAARLSRTQLRKTLRAAGLNLRTGRCYGPGLRRQLRQDRASRVSLKRVKAAHTSALKMCLQQA